jgi:F-type H+-transporting ATPase subunit c
MRKLLLIVLNSAVFILMAGFAFAQQGPVVEGIAFVEEIPADVISMIAIGAAIGMGLAALGTGIGMGFGLKGACEGTARNPDVSGKITVTMLIGLAMIESLAIYTLVVDLIILFANPYL